tara:strand:+ start:876 stop:1334 length:459 start_codon:yes stop_codon:yes gene_type:complete
MDVQKYRKIYLEWNWGNNHFKMIEYYVDLRDRLQQNNLMTIDFQRNHPLVLSKEAFWITHDKLCIGYELNENPEIFRPIFSHKRQRLIDRIHKFTLLFDNNGEKTNEDEKGHTIDNPYKFWNKNKSKYFKEIYKIKNIPVECIKCIVMFVSK